MVSTTSWTFFEVTLQAVAEISTAVNSAFPFDFQRCVRAWWVCQWPEAMISRFRAPDLARMLWAPASLCLGRNIYINPQACITSGLLELAHSKTGRTDTKLSWNLMTDSTTTTSVTPIRQQGFAWRARFWTQQGRFHQRLQPEAQKPGWHTRFHTTLLHQYACILTPRPKANTDILYDIPTIFWVQVLYKQQA